MINILLVDDHHIVRQATRALLAGVEGFQVVAEAESGEEAVKCISSHAVDIVLIDIQMPGIGGLEASRRLLAKYPEVKIIVLSTLSEETHLHHFFRLGVKSYLSKEAPLSEILKALNAVCSGKSYIDTQISTRLLTKILQNVDSSPFVALSFREMEVALMLVEGFSLDKISQKLAMSPKTVSRHRQRLLQKLGIKTHLELVRSAMQNGILTAAGEKSRPSLQKVKIYSS